MRRKADGTVEYFSAFFLGIPVYSPRPPVISIAPPITNLDATVRHRTSGNTQKEKEKTMKKVTINEDQNVGGFFARVFRDEGMDKDIPLADSTDIDDDDSVLCDVIDAIGGDFDDYEIVR